MEKTFYIKATRKEIDLLSRYSANSLFKMYYGETWVTGDIYKHKVMVRLSEDAQIENGKTYSFKNYLMRTDDILFLDFLNDIDLAVKRYNVASVNYRAKKRVGETNGNTESN